MKTIKYLGLILGLALMIQSCKKETLPELGQDQTGLQLSGDSYDSDGSISLVFDHSMSASPPSGVEGTGHIHAGFKNSGGQLVNVGNVSINGQNLTIDPTTDAYNEQLSSDNISNFLGRNCTFSMDGGNGFSSLSESVYLPRVMQAYSPSIESGIHAVSQDMEINWNSDPANSTVVIGVVYQGEVSAAISPGMEGTNSGQYFVVSDNGNYVIPASVFASFPVGGQISIRVGRGYHSEVVGASGKKIMLSGITISNTLVELAP